MTHSYSTLGQCLPLNNWRPRLPQLSGGLMLGSKIWSTGCRAQCSTAVSWCYHTRKVMLKILQARLQQYVNRNFQMFKLVSEMQRNKRSNCQHLLDHRIREFQKNIYFCFIDYAKAFDCVDHNKLWKILKEMGIPDHLTCLLRNLYAGQEATVRTGHGTTDWFPIGKRIRQGCILSPCLFNLNAENIMRNAELDGWSTGWNQDCWEKYQ